MPFFRSRPARCRTGFAVPLLASFLLVPVGAASARPAPASFADLAARLLPAVVNISSTETVKADAGSDDEGGDDGGGGDGQGGGGPGGGESQTPSPFPPGSPFEKFFHDFLNRQHGTDGAPAPRRMQSLGSGFIIDPSGLVVTNNHVIAGADAITVTLQDNTVLTATVIGHDDQTDLALLRVHADRPLTAVAWGDSNAARVGDWDLAIGNPFGLGGTVTAGIVSARGRDIQEGPYDDFIQTDAPINRGNSGGPLFDMDGGVIGINTAIYSPSGGSIGIGFAIPSVEAKLVIDQLRQFGHTRRGWIGIRIQPVTADIAKGLGLKPAQGGALVAGIDPKGPAAAASLRTGDVVLRFNNAPVAEMRTLPRMVAETPIGAAVPVVVWRNGKTVTLAMTIAELPAKASPPPTTNRAPPKPTPAATALPALGMTVAPVDDALRRRFSLGADQRGVVVTAVAANGIASDHGLKPGDVVLEIQQTNITRPAQIVDAIAEAKRSGRTSLLVLVEDSDGSRWVPMPLTDKG